MGEGTLAPPRAPTLASLWYLSLNQRPRIGQKQGLTQLSFLISDSRRELGQPDVTGGTLGTLRVAGGHTKVLCPDVHFEKKGLNSKFHVTCILS